MAEDLLPDDPVEQLVDDDELDVDPDDLDPEELPSQPEDVVVAEDAPTPIGRSWAFDFAAGRFMPAPARGPLETHGVATIRGWIEKCMRTARGGHPIHSPGYGFESPSRELGIADSPELAASLEARITDALTFHPKITEIQDFSAEFDNLEEILDVSFTVILDDETEVPVTIGQL